MSERDEPTTSSTTSTDEPESKRIGTVGLIGAAFVVLIIVIGLVISLVVLNRDQDTPLVPADGTAAGDPATPDPENSSEFEPDPVFDALQRVVYVPKDQNGVILDQQRPPAGRSPQTPPAGVMLQRIHDNMVLPFSSSDGPTEIDSSGVATGFSHTPQGAALAAAHYMAYLTTGNDRIDMLTESRQIDNPDTDVKVRKMANDLNGPASVAPGSPATALPSVRLDYADSLSRVWFGYSSTLKDGSTQYRRVRADFVWRGERGWVLQARKDGDPQGPTIYGTADKNPLDEPGWMKWW